MIAPGGGGIRTAADAGRPQQKRACKKPQNINCTYGMGGQIAAPLSFFAKI